MFFRSNLHQKPKQCGVNRGNAFFFTCTEIPRFNVFARTCAELPWSFVVHRRVESIVTNWPQDQVWELVENLGRHVLMDADEWAPTAKQ